MRTLNRTSGLSARPVHRLITGDLTAFRRDPLAFMTGLASDRPGVAPFRLGPRQAALVSGPEEFKQVLVSKATDFEKGKLQRRALVPVLRNGLLISEGELHDRQRKLLAPLFAGRKLARYIAMITQQADRHSSRLTDGAEVDLLDVMGAITRDVIRTMLWTEPLEEDARLTDAVTRAFTWEMHQMLSIAPAPVWVPTRGNGQLRRDLAFARTTIARVIEERRLRPGDQDDMLTELLNQSDDRSAMSDDQLLDELLTLWGAAHETSADAQFWCAYLLARHPGIRARVEGEADRVLGDRLPTPEDLERLPVALQVFKEAMRLYPPAAALIREARTDTLIGDVRIRKGTLVFLSVYALHHNAELYPDPHRFDPDRFTPQADKSRHRFAYLPFGAGPHVCIGSRLALTEGQIFTAVLARQLRFELDADSDVPPQLLINLRPSRSVTATVRRRPARATESADA